MYKTRAIKIADYKNTENPFIYLFSTLGIQMDDGFLCGIILSCTPG